ncbi:MAG: hypothetical protein ACK49N_02965 [Verrucomicrobiota bacterium]
MESNANYLLQLAHSSHLPLQQVAQSLSLQHSGQLGPAAWTDATVAMKAKAIAVMNDFIIFIFCVRIQNWLCPRKSGPTQIQIVIRGGGTGGAQRRSSARSLQRSQRRADLKRGWGHFFSAINASGWASCPAGQVVHGHEECVEFFSQLSWV